VRGRASTEGGEHYDGQLLPHAEVVCPSPDEIARALLEDALTPELKQGEIDMSDAHPSQGRKSC
jgi:hypothetical protein